MSYAADTIPVLRCFQRPVVTRREAEVQKLVAQGHQVRTIAERLGISAKTVESHKENLKLKLKCTTSDFPLVAVRLGLVRVEVTGELRGAYPDLCE